MLSSPRTDGERAQTISNALTRLHREGLAFRRAMESNFIALVEETTGRKVIPFLSQVRLDHDKETFMLEPQKGDAAPKG